LKEKKKRKASKKVETRNETSASELKLNGLQRERVAGGVA
jgi:hypothetical protein